MSTTKPPTKRQLVETARATALAGNWEEAVTRNRDIIERDPKDAEAYNRLGRAFLELGDYAGALDAYSGAFKCDPANMIARRNLRRLEYLRGRKSSAGKAETRADRRSIPRTAVLIEEVGKTWVDELVHPLAMTELALVLPGEQLDLEADGEHLYVVDARSKRLGEIDPRTADRMLELLGHGYIYEVFALGLANASLRVILREVARDPAMGGRVSFPRQISRTNRYLREREALRQRDEADFLHEDEELDEDGVVAGRVEDEESGEPEPFEEETSPEDEENRL